MNLQFTICPAVHLRVEQTWGGGIHGGEGVGLKQAFAIVPITLG